MNNSSTTTNKRSNTSRNRRRRLKRNANVKAKKRQVKPASTAPRAVVHLSECTRSYAQAVLNPFSSFKELPCIPDLTIVPSNKIQVKVRGVFSTGTMGVGFVAFNPFTSIFNNTTGTSGFNDAPVLYTTSSWDEPGYDYSFSDITGAPGTGLAVANSNSPYVGEQGLDWQWRLVAAGLRIRCIGAPLYMQGSSYQIRSADNSDILPVQSGSDFLQDNYTSREPVTRASRYVYYTPAKIEYTSYHGRAYYQPTQTGLQQYILLMYVDGAIAMQNMPFEFEATAFFEIVGTGLPLTPSHSDPTGYGSTLATLPNRAPERSPEQESSGFLARIGQTIVENTSQVFGATVNAGAQMIGAAALQGIASATGFNIPRRSLTMG